MIRSIRPKEATVEEGQTEWVGKELTRRRRHGHAPLRAIIIRVVDAFQVGVRPEDALRYGVYGQANGRAQVLCDYFRESRAVQTGATNKRRIVPIGDEEKAHKGIERNRRGFL